MYSVGVSAVFEQKWTLHIAEHRFIEIPTAFFSIAYAYLIFNDVFTVYVINE